MRLKEDFEGSRAVYPLAGGVMEWGESRDRARPQWQGGAGGARGRGAARLQRHHPRTPPSTAAPRLQQGKLSYEFQQFLAWVGIYSVAICWTRDESGLHNWW